MIRSAALSSVVSEFWDADLGDERRNKRLELIAAALEREPSASFPTATGSTAGLEGLYRFLNSKDFELEDIVEPHADATFARAAQEQTVIAIHDSTQFTFSTERDGFGATAYKAVRRGFLAHMCLLAAEVDGTPLGIGHVETWTRTGTKHRKLRADRGTGKKPELDPKRESLRWGRAVEAVEQRTHHQFDVVHVADAESDAYELMLQMIEADAAFVIRCGNLRRGVFCDGIECSVEEAAALAAPRVKRSIEISERKYSKTQARIRSTRHPQRAARTAQIAIGSVEILIPRPRDFPTDVEDISLNCVRVWEPSPVKGQPPIEWVLFTNLPASSRQELIRIVDIYRKRWLIEEYFKVLKTGCAIEKRQVASYAALTKVLAIFIPIANRLLLLRRIQDRRPQAKATEAFTEIELHLMATAPSNLELKPPKTVEEAMLHLARLGGHLRNNGRPGWLTLGRGYQKLLLLLQGWHAANEFLKKSDQS